MHVKREGWYYSSEEDPPNNLLQQARHQRLRYPTTSPTQPVPMLSSSPRLQGPRQAALHEPANECTWW